MLTATDERCFVGLDVHLRSTTMCIVNSQGRIVKERKVQGHSAEVVEALKQSLRGPFDVVLEASDGYGLWYEKLSRVARRVVVAHPSHLNSIWNCKRKNDRVDAGKLARLLFMDLVPAVHVPRAEVRDWRTLIQHRRSLVQKRTAIKNKLRAILRRNHVKAPRNLWSNKNRAWLAAQELPSISEALQRDMGLEELVHLDKQIRRVEVELDRRADSHPAVAVLKTIPGVGNRTAEAIVAWIDEVGRFARCKQVGAYFGLVPSEDSSGGAQRLGRITRQGPGVVRQMLVEAIWRMCRRNGVVRAWVKRFQHEQPKRKAIAVVAAAHKLARCMFAMLRSGEVWSPRGKPVMLEGKDEREFIALRATGMKNRECP